MSVIEEYAILGFAIRERDCREKLIADITEDHFENERTRELFQVITILTANGDKPTPSTINKHMADGIDAVDSSWRASMDSDGFEPSLKVVQTSFQQRAYNRMAQRLLALTEGDHFDPELAESIITDHIPYRPDHPNKEYMVTAKTAAQLAWESILKARETPGQITGTRMSYELNNGNAVGFKSLDYTLNGLRGGDLIMVAAQSGHGKTALAMNLSRIMSYHNGNRVYYLNTEMDIEQMVYRWIAMATRIEYERIDRGEINDSELERIMEWKERFEQSPMLVSRIPSLSVDLVKGLAKQAIAKYGVIDCLVVDYVGRMNLDNTRNMQEYQILSAITKALKETAIELNIPIIALAQLNEDGKLEGAKKMRNECDGLFFFKPKVTEGKDDEGQKVNIISQSEYYLIKEKVRRGSTAGVIHCEFDKPFQFIREV